jgi:hypothetical protein
MLEDIFKDVTYPQLLIVLIGSYILYDFIQKVIEDRKIRKLGGRAPLRPAWLPWSVDLAYQGVRSVINNTTFEYMQRGLKTYGNKNHPYTIELRVGQ